MQHRFHGKLPYQKHSEREMRYFLLCAKNAPQRIIFVRMLFPSTNSKKIENNTKKPIKNPYTRNAMPMCSTSKIIDVGKHRNMQLHHTNNQMHQLLFADIQLFMCLFWSEIPVFFSCNMLILLCLYNLHSSRLCT